MGKHSVPHGEYSTLGKPNGAPQTPGYEAKHDAQPENRPGTNSRLREIRDLPKK